MRVISLDLETHDPYLKKYGSGAPFHDSEILTVCACEYDMLGEIQQTATGKGCNLISHINITKKQTKELLDRADVIVGSNIQYDLHYLYMKWGLEPKKDTKIADILINERLLDTIAQKVNLNSLAKKYLGEEKKDDEIIAEAHRLKIAKPMENLKKIIAASPNANLWMISKYCYADTQQTMDVFLEQFWLIQKAHLSKQMQVEMDIQRIIFEMKKAGVPFDVEYSKKLEEEMEIELGNITKKLLNTFGTSNFGTDEGKWTLHKYCNNKGLNIKLTTKSKKPQVDKNFFARNQNDENIELIQEYKTLLKLKNDFVIKLRSMAIDGKIYPSINAMKSEEGGAITGRFSMAKPNLQQIPSRNPEWAKKIRMQFRAPEGFTWIKADYSQQEVRLLFEFAEDEGMIQRYKEDPTTDAYNIVVDLFTNRGFPIGRPVSKTLVLGAQYCMGIKKLSVQLLCTEDEAKDLRGRLFNIFPSVKQYQRDTIDLIESRGLRTKDKIAYIETISGRKIYLEVVRKEQETKNGMKVGFVKEVDRAYRGINYSIQGSGADIMKKALINCMERGLQPVLSVHDELNFLVPTKEVARWIPVVRDSMENTYKMKIPMVVDIEVGSSWGEVQYYEERIESLGESQAEIKQSEGVSCG